MEPPVKIGSLINFRGSIGVIIDHDWEEHDPIVPFHWVQVYWCEDQEYTWETWEDNSHHFEVIG